ncbi:putative membrane protein [Yersinia rohdei]|uniref:Membrane protein n=1 Tax=Yersinia rohdei TaxID=29485 RepID=A0A0U1HQV3_YERRO|nr:putative membrane protein [Yersinia rohdei]EEQ00902.1 hypothetical protein yrohd0001_1220 [Yersinia rohdei ATCC 43380]CNF29899.1 Uncharacterised protein [Yersinia rohdei]CQI88872.1 Uncharacterised protein [Yersinia rohdei]CQJ56594.1 Uncharacterised protein [Yersinia rohdei]
MKFDWTIIILIVATTLSLFYVFEMAEWFMRWWHEAEMF